MAAALIRPALARLVLAVERQRAVAGAEHAMPAADLTALAHVDAAGEISPGRLAQVLLLSSSGTTAVVDRLVAAGLVERVPASAAGARRGLRATARGRDVLAEVSAPLDAAVAEACAALAADERAPVERFLLRIADAAERDAERGARALAAAARAAAAAPSPPRWG